MSAHSDAAALLDAAPCSTILPAGSGKTEILAHACAVEVERGGRPLVLTHTNAGVQALRERLRKVGVPEAEVDLRTIASFADPWCRNYRVLSAHLEIPEPGDYPAWYQGSARVLRSATIGRVVQTSWSLLLVDEYQDCTVLQHEMILATSSWIPTVVVGDPLQSVYNFQNERTVDWAAEVFGVFPVVVLPVSPHRWNDANAALGQELSHVRTLLEAGHELDLKRYGQIAWRQTDHRTRSGLVKNISKRSGSSLVIQRHRSQCYALAKRSGGALDAMEDLAATDLVRAAKAIDASEPEGRFEVVMRLAAECMSKLPTGYGARVADLAAGKSPRFRANSKLGPITTAAMTARSTGSPKDLLALATEISATPGIVLARRELWDDLLRALSVAAAARDLATEDAVALTRSRLRRRGRRPSDQTAATSLLVKGLEFDHVLIVGADTLSTEELYVGLTRARHSLVVVSDSPLLRPTSNRA